MANALSKEEAIKRAIKLVCDGKCSTLSAMGRYKVFDGLDADEYMDTYDEIERELGNYIKRVIEE